MRKGYFVRLMGITVGMWILVYSILIPKSMAASVPGVTNDTITIGIIVPMNALFSKHGEMDEAMFLEWGKNINGRSIKVIRLDDSLDPVKGIAAAKKLIFDEKVFMLCAGQSSNVCLAIKPTVETTGIPLVTLGCISDAMYVPVVKNIFNPVYAASAAAPTLADFAMTIPGNNLKFGVIRHSDEWSTSLNKSLVDYLKSRYNKSMSEEVVVERGTGDVTSSVLKLKQAKLDCIFSILMPPDTTAFLRDAYNLGLDVPIVGSTSTSVSDQYASLKTLEPLKKYFGPISLKYPLDHPKVKVYENMLKKYFPNTKFDAWAVYAPGGPLVVMDALKKCGRDLTREKFIDILEREYTNWEPENYIGATPLNFSKTNHIGMSRLVMSTIATGKYSVVQTYQDYKKLME